ARLVYWQTFGRGELLGRATDQVRSDLVLTAHRGIIRDRGGATLATTVELRSLYAIPAQMTDREKNDLRGSVATAIAPILGEKAEVLRAAFSSGAEWLFVGRRLPEATADRIAALDPRARVVADVRPRPRRKRRSRGAARSDDRLDLRAGLDDEADHDRRGPRQRRRDAGDVVRRCWLRDHRRPQALQRARPSVRTDERHADPRALRER